MEDLGTALSDGDLRRAYAGRRVLITGITGFKGAWLASWLVRLGADVRGLALDPPTVPSLWDMLRLGDAVPWDRVDLRDANTVAAVVENARPEVIFHMGAQALVPEARRDPLGTLQTNTLGTANVLEATRHAGRPLALVCVTTDKCYAPSPTGQPHHELDRLGGHEVYAASKAAAELVVTAWRQSWFPVHRLASHGVLITTARSGNAVGPGDHAPDRLVPDALRAFRAGTPLVLRRPHAVRPWQHVLAPLWGYLMLGAHTLVGAPNRARWSGPWNFGPPPDDEVPVAQVITTLAEAWGPTAQWTPPPSTLPETGVLRLDSHQAQRRLGWRCPWPLDHVLRRVVGGEQMLDRGDAVAMVTAELDAFTKAIAP